MKTQIYPFFFIGALTLTLSGSFLYAEEVPTCPRCQIIREENAKKGPPEYEYYDDYLRAQEAKKSPNKDNSKELEETKAASDQRNIEAP